MIFEIIILVAYFIIGLSFSVFIFYYEVQESIKNDEDLDLVYHSFRAFTLGVTIWPMIAVIGAIHLTQDIIKLYRMQDSGKYRNLDLPADKKENDK